MVSLNAPVFFGTVANASDWASITIFSLIMGEFLRITGLGFPSAYVRFFHLLTHRTDVIIFFLIVVQIFFAECFVFRLIMGILLFIEGVVFYIRCNIVLFQQFIVLLAPITCIGSEFF